jgi:hypothetical protein
MKKVFRVLCEVDNGYAIEKYNTYVFGFNEDEAKNVAATYWEGISPNICVCALEIELICENEVKVIGAERVY